MNPRQSLSSARYYSLADFLDAASEKRCVNTTNEAQARAWRAGQNGSREWLGLAPVGPEATLTDIVGMIQSGWERGAARIAEALDQLAPDLALPIDLRRRPTWREEGGEVDVHRIYAGDLEHAWRGVTRGAHRAARTITLGVDSICPGATRADALFWRGAAVVRLCDMLQEHGFSVCIRTGFSGRTLYGEKVECIVTVKEPGRPASLVDLAACTAFPAFFRMVGHHWIQTHAHAPTRMSGIIPGSLSGDFADYIAGNSVDTEKEAGKWVKATVAAINSLEQQTEEE